MAQMIKSPQLQSVNPPYFELDVGHSAKVVHEGQPVWGRVIDIRGDEFLGIIHSPEDARRRVSGDLRGNDVIAFERQHVFGMF